MTAEIVNLRKVRKARSRREAEVQAAEHRQRFGQRKAEREARQAQDHIAQRRLEGHRLDGAEPDLEGARPQGPGGSGNPDQPV